MRVAFAYYEFDAVVRRAPFSAGTDQATAAWGEYTQLHEVALLLCAGG